MSEYILNVETRTNLGKGASSRLRRTDLVPAVVYGNNQEVLSISLRQNEITRCLMDNNFYSSEVTLQFDDGKTEQVTICDLQRHPVKSHAMHADFKRV
jgi:large subunit ribosomal protein L25